MQNKVTEGEWRKGKEKEEKEEERSERRNEVQAGGERKVRKDRVGSQEEKGGWEDFLLT
jgi:hypothetical protein